MKRLFAIALALLLVATGCGAGGNSSSQEEIPEASVVESEPESTPEASPDEEEQPESAEADDQEEPAELVENQYEGLTLSAAVLERKAILPGFAVPITVKIANTGDRTLLYTQGSGVFEVPDALVLHSQELQPVRTKDRLGIMTMDFVTQELEPGQELEYVLYVMTIKPNDKFDEYTYDLYGEDESYIADLDWETLRERHSDLEAVEAGSYTVYVDFQYAVADEDGAGDPFGGPTGFARTECVIGVS